MALAVILALIGFDAVTTFCETRRIAGSYGKPFRSSGDGGGGDGKLRFGNMALQPESSLPSAHFGSQTSISAISTD
jgi:hypothetical protein